VVESVKLVRLDPHDEAEALLGFGSCFCFGSTPTPTPLLLLFFTAALRVVGAMSLCEVSVRVTNYEFWNVKVKQGVEKVAE
jgi:hypothetical protein